MDLSIGTFNLNNLFSRFNLYAEVPPRDWLIIGLGQLEGVLDALDEGLSAGDRGAGSP